MENKKNGIVFLNKHTKQFLAWAEMAPTWVSAFENACVQTDPYQLLVDIITLQRYGFAPSDYLMLYIVDNNTIRVVDLDKYAIA